MSSVSATTHYYLRSTSSSSSNSAININQILNLSVLTPKEQFNESQILSLHDVGLINVKNRKCPKCNSDLHLQALQRSPDGWALRCSRSSCHAIVSIKTGSFFENRRQT